ncbi:MAG: ABC transporter permease [Planctomycetota bacterium]
MNAVAPYGLLWRHRVLLQRTTRSELKARFAGSLFGLAWLLGYPLLLLGAYASVFVFVLKVDADGFESPLDYVLLIFSGLIPFLGFAEGLGAGTPSVAGSANLIKNTLFPIELVPVRAVLVSQAVQVVGSVLLLATLVVTGGLTPWALLLPVVWLLQVMFTIGLIWIVSSVNVYLRDLQQMISVITLFLMMVSPIGVSAAAMTGPLTAFSACNPLWYVICCHQDLLVYGRMPPANAMLGLVLLGVGFFSLGHWFFTRMKRVLVDNV